MNKMILFYFLTHLICQKIELWQTVSAWLAATITTKMLICLSVCRCPSFLSRTICPRSFKFYTHARTCACVHRATPAHAHCCPHSLLTNDIFFAAIIFLYHRYYLQHYVFRGCNVKWYSKIPFVFQIRISIYIKVTVTYLWYWPMLFCFINLWNVAKMALVFYRI